MTKAQIPEKQIKLYTNALGVNLKGSSFTYKQTHTHTHTVNNDLHLPGSHVCSTIYWRHSAIRVMPDWCYSRTLRSIGPNDRSIILSVAVTKSNMPSRNASVSQWNNSDLIYQDPSCIQGSWRELWTLVMEDDQKIASRAMRYSNVIHSFNQKKGSWLPFDRLGFINHSEKKKAEKILKYFTLVLVGFIWYLLKTCTVIRLSAYILSYNGRWDGWSSYFRLLNGILMSPILTKLN